MLAVRSEASDIHARKLRRRPNSVFAPRALLAMVASRVQRGAPQPARSTKRFPGACIQQGFVIAALLADVDKPPLDRVGALEGDAFVTKPERRALAAALNTLLASFRRAWIKPAAWPNFVARLAETVGGLHDEAAHAAFA